MGFSISLTACLAKDKDAFLAAAGLSCTSDKDPEMETLLSGGVVGEYFITWRNLRMMKTFAAPLYEGMSQGVDFIALEVVETSMGAQVSAYAKGKMLWSFSGADGEIEQSGPVPMSVKELEALALLQDPQILDVDDGDEPYYDPFALAVELFVALTGFRYDEVHDETFHKLDGEMPYPKPWWKFW